MEKLSYILYWACLSLSLSLPCLGALPGVPAIDSLKTALVKGKNDTNQVSTLNDLCMRYKIIGAYDSALIYGNEAKLLSVKLGYQKGLANSIANIGVVYSRKGRFAEALSCHEIALKIREEIGDLKGISASYNNIGVVYYKKGKLDDALLNYRASLKTRKEIGDKLGIVGSCNNIGIIYSELGNYPAALEYLLMSLKIAEELKDNIGIGDSYDGIGSIYYSMGNFNEAIRNYRLSLDYKTKSGEKSGTADTYNNLGLVYCDLAKQSKEASSRMLLIQKSIVNHQNCLKIKTAIGDRGGVAISNLNLGIVYLVENNFRKALEAYRTSLKIMEEIGDERGIASSYENLGVCQLEMKNYSEAETNIKFALTISARIGYAEVTKNSYKSLSDIYSALGRNKKALMNYRRFIEVRDTLLNEENTKKTVQMQMNYEFDKKEAAGRLEQEKRDALATEKSKKQRMVIFAVCAGLLLVLILAGVIFRSLRINQKKNLIIHAQKNAVERQKELIEEKQKEIIASITYARRIQRSLLTSESYIFKNLSKIRS